MTGLFITKDDASILAALPASGSAAGQAPRAKRGRAARPGADSESAAERNEQPPPEVEGGLEADIRTQSRPCRHFRPEPGYRRRAWPRQARLAGGPVEHSGFPAALATEALGLARSGLVAGVFAFVAVGSFEIPARFSCRAQPCVADAARPVGPFVARGAHAALRQGFGLSAFDAQAARDARGGVPGDTLAVLAAILGLMPSEGHRDSAGVSWRQVGTPACSRAAIAFHRQWMASVRPVPDERQGMMRTSRAFVRNAMQGCRWFGFPDIDPFVTECSVHEVQGRWRLCSSLSG